MGTRILSSVNPALQAKINDFVALSVLAPPEHAVAFSLILEEKEFAAQYLQRAWDGRANEDRSDEHEEGFSQNS